MSTINFLAGEKVIVKGRKGSFTYVKKNIVRDVTTGRTFGVIYSSIRKPGLLSLIKSLF